MALILNSYLILLHFIYIEYLKDGADSRLLYYLYLSSIICHPYLYNLIRGILEMALILQFLPYFCLFFIICSSYPYHICFASILFSYLKKYKIILLFYNIFFYRILYLELKNHQIYESNLLIIQIIQIVLISSKKYNRENRYVFTIKSFSIVKTYRYFQTPENNNLFQSFMETWRIWMFSIIYNDCDKKPRRIHNPKVN